MDDDSILVQQEEEEEEEAISLCDFLITTDQSEFDGLSKFQDRRSSYEPTDLFEFFNHLTAASEDMSHAEDIISCGKLIPFKEQPLSDQTHKLHGQRSELKSSQSLSNKSTPLIIRNSRSLSHQKLRRTLSASSEVRRNSSVRISGGLDNCGQKVSRPRWYLLMFGLAKFPPAMELKDIKNRQVRRSSATMFAPFDGCEKLPVNRKQRKSSWSLLGVLSCKGHAGVEVTTSSSCLPQDDVFAITSKAMLFNPSSSIYFRQARAIDELARRVFHTLKTDPKRIELEFSLSRRQHGRKPQGDNTTGNSRAHHGSSGAANPHPNEILPPPGTGVAPNGGCDGTT